MQERIRVARITSRLNIGGPTWHVVNLNAGLDRSVFESILITGPPRPGEGSLDQYVEEQGIKPITIPGIVPEASIGLRDLKAINRLRRLFREFRPHIVHTHTMKAGFVGRIAARMSGVPIIVHTYHGHVLTGYFGSAKSLLLQRLERLLSSATSELVAVSEQVRQDLVRLGVARSDRITVIPLGLSLDQFFSIQDKTGIFRREFGLSSEVPVVAIVGRIAPIKNHSLFLKAAALLNRTQPAVHFVVVGDGELRPALEAESRRMGLDSNITFTGWRHDLASIYSDIDVLVVSSDNEGTPVSAIEAMAASRPVVGTTVGGMPDLIETGRTGLLVPKGDEQSLADAVRRIIDNPELGRQVGLEARRDVSARYTAKRLVADVETLYANLLSRVGLPRPPGL